ncbi:major facilitator superfamily MFS1 [Cercophora newfieldiana]|uniref:Major facilitator superfamily MFS1 n=1 Tax=Cercophora newfieldiana TaxID=92897 RepID=A0AA39YA72_9PEZI|nr:major facilitator superfamily MFS1 [Cercophora newfieldiana]
MAPGIHLLRSWSSRLATESGISTIAQSCRNTKILCLQRFVRLFAYGASFLILVHFLSDLGFSQGRIGLFMTATLLGDTILSSLLTVVTDQVGRRLVLAVGAVSMVASGLVFAFGTNYWLLLFASVLGVISPSGNEIGPFRAVEESILAHLTEKEKRSDVFAWYTLFGTAGAALGALASGWMVQTLQHSGTWDTTKAYRAVFMLYAALGVVKLLLVFCLGSGVELQDTAARYQQVPTEPEDGDVSYGSTDEGQRSQQEGGVSNSGNNSNRKSFLQRVRSLLPHITPESRSILFRLLLLFSLDSFASGIASPSWLTYFFSSVHSLNPSTLGTLFFVTNILATISNLLALPLARRIGPLKTMVFTHLPSAVFLGLIALPPATPLGTWLAMALLSLRASTQSMDQAPRQAFISAAVLPGERTAILGVVNVVKTLAQAGGIGSAGVFSGKNLWVAALGLAGAMKASYDLLMLWMFLGLGDREE